MSKYTTEVRFICESLSGLSESADGARVEEIISSSRPKIFDFDYPIFDVTYKEVIETAMNLIAKDESRETDLRGKSKGLEYYPWVLKCNPLRYKSFSLFKPDERLFLTAEELPFDSC